MESRNTVQERRLTAAGTPSRARSPSATETPIKPLEKDIKADRCGDSMETTAVCH